MPFDHGREAARFQLLIHGASTLRWYPIDRPTLVIGRASDCEIVLGDPSVSRHHVVLEVIDGRVHFRELSDTNPVQLDDERCTEGILEIGSSLRIGLTQIDLFASTDLTTVAITEDHMVRTVILEPTAASAESTAHPGSIARGASRVSDSILGLIAKTDDESSFAHAILIELSELTSRQSAVLATVDGDSLTVIASRGDRPEPLRIPRSALEPAHEYASGFAIEAGHADGEWLVTPLPGPERRVVVLGRPKEDAVDARTALTIARALIEPAVALADLKARATDAEREIDRLRFARTHAYRSIFTSARLALVRRKLAEAARQRLPVRMFGEEGTETAQLARFLHAESDAAGARFVECYVRLLRAQAAQESLFGAAASSARGGIRGCFAYRGTGTVYVHEPELLPPELQEMLAAELEASLDPEAKLRIVIAHGCDKCDAAELRLVPRLATVLDTAVTVCIPPLRGHEPDVDALTECVLEELGPPSSGTSRVVDATARAALLAYDWPGNTAQHRRVVERAAMRAGNRPIGLGDLEPQIRELDPAKRRTRTLEEVSIEHIYRAIELAGGNKRRAAKDLDIASSTLYEWLRRHPKRPT